MSSILCLLGTALKSIDQYVEYPSAEIDSAERSAVIGPPCWRRCRGTGEGS